MKTLYGMGTSPWTERARWALEHHELPYRYHEHVPMLGEPLLRRKAKAKRATVPLLDDGGTVVMGSYEIARYVDRQGRGSQLVPRDTESEIARWNGVGERMCEIGRVWILGRMRADRGALREALPSFIPGVLRGALAPSTALGLSFIAKKYELGTSSLEELQAMLRPLLQEVRTALGGKPYLVEQFTYADVVIASALHVVRPHENAQIGPAVREAWSNATLASEFDDLLMWRDALYGKHR